jgi:general stress protein YciG
MQYETENKQPDDSAQLKEPKQFDDQALGHARGARGTAAMDPRTRQEVARKGGLAVSRNRQHMAEIGRKGGQAVSKNREHMAKIGRKGGAASRGTGAPGTGSLPGSNSGSGGEAGGSFEG